MNKVNIESLIEEAEGLVDRLKECLGREPENRERLECWANEYPDRVMYHLTEGFARSITTPSLIRTVRLVEPPTRDEWDEKLNETAWGHHRRDLIDFIASMGCVTEEKQ